MHARGAKLDAASATASATASTRARTGRMILMNVLFDLLTGAALGVYSPAMIRGERARA